MRSTPLFIGAVACLVCYMIAFYAGHRDPVFIATSLILFALGGAVGD